VAYNLNFDYIASYTDKTVFAKATLVVVGYQNHLAAAFQDTLQEGPQARQFP